MEISNNLRESYENQYDQYDASLKEWREIGAKYKAQNIKNLAKGITFKNVLEVGAGEGSILNWLSRWNFSENLYGIEISESGVRAIKQRNIPHLKDISLFDGYHIPYPENYFDLLICSHVMEHVEHERTLLREIKRVSYYQIFEVPIDFSFYVDKKVNHFLSYGHINIYTPALFRFLLLTENFQILRDCCHMYDTQVLKVVYKNNPWGFYKARIKNQFIKMIPYLLGIKPNAYAVLTAKK
jgi:ubiquinone/menaquinone biosynthesis C-methylase UbiE